MRTLPAVRLNADEVMLGLFGAELGDQHEAILEKTLLLLFEKALEMQGSGIHVILDCGFWQKPARIQANAWFAQHGIRPEWHYLDISDEGWQRNIKVRNQQAALHSTTDYAVCEAILDKFRNPEDVPLREEMDVWISEQP